jgi:hypothetical protein
VDTRPSEHGGYGSLTLAGGGRGGRGGCGGVGGTLTGDGVVVWWSVMAARQWQRCSLMGRFLELGEKREAGMGVVEEG